MYVWSVCKYKRDAEAHGQGELECSGHVTKPGLVLTLPCLFGESRAINGDPFWSALSTAVWVKGPVSLAVALPRLRSLLSSPS